MSGAVGSLRPVRGRAREIHALLRSWNDHADPPPLVVETSGSTGDPKRVVLSRRAMRASAEGTHARLGGPGHWLLALPASYVAGLQVLFRSVLAGSEPVVQDEHPGFVSAAAAMTGRRRYVSLVPTQLARMLRSTAETEALRGFDAVLVGGAGLDEAQRSAAEAAGIRVVTTYGMSETCGGCVYDGVPLDGVAVAVGTDGRVRLGGPVLFDGYDGRPDLTAEVLVNGWFLTADTGRLDDDGRLELLGRVDDVVVSGGVNVPTPAVAARLREHGAVAAAEVVGVPDDEWGHRVVAVVVPEPGAVETAAGLLPVLRDFVGDRLPRTWAPREVVLVPELPLLPNGKVDRVALRELASGRQAAAWAEPA